MKSNIHKKYTYEDKFARRWYCKNARLRQLRFEKRQQKRRWRRINKEMYHSSDTL